MIELIPASHDDPAFLAFIQRIINGAVAALKMREVFLVHVDNWFDHKWLRFWCWNANKLCLPPFNPNRICAERRLVFDENRSEWTREALKKPLHARRPGRPSSIRRLDGYSKSAAFVWYSGNTAINGAGSLMFYVSETDVYSWYASFRKKGDWKIEDGFEITRRELESFERRARQMEVVRT